jgi:3-deoxy-7-phosphoheptulonate synthase
METDYSGMTTPDSASEREVPSDAPLAREVTLAPPVVCLAPLAPNWIYGTTLSPASRAAPPLRLSGLCLSERGSIVAIPQPEVIQNTLFPIGLALQAKIVDYRERLNQLLNHHQRQQPLLVVTGPSCVSNANQVKACAQWVGTIIGKRFANLPTRDLPPAVRQLYQPRATLPQHLLLAIRANLTHYNHPYTDSPRPPSIMTFEIEHGIPVCRALLCELAEICPIVGQMCDTITPQYFADLFCLGLVDLSLVESQLHRELVLALLFPVGFSTLVAPQAPFDRDLYRHKIGAALDAMYASSQPHQFVSITKIGTVAVVGTIGNADTFVVLDVDPSVFMSQQDIVDFVSLVYKYKNLQHSQVPKPRVMLNVGRLLDADYEPKLKLVALLLSDSPVAACIFGVIVDSGDHYIPQGFHFDLDEELPSPATPAADGDSYQKLLDINRYFVKKQSFAHDSATTPAMPVDQYYECLINADRFIGELECIQSSAKEA